ncbi:hypothetical protein J3F83DRAFT_152945 [Trichoderma novae-zelandiae]
MLPILPSQLVQESTRLPYVSPFINGLLALANGASFSAHQTRRTRHSTSQSTTRHTTRLLHSGTVPAPALVCCSTLPLAQPMLSGPVSDCLSRLLLCPLPLPLPLLCSASVGNTPPPSPLLPLLGQAPRSLAASVPRRSCLHSRKHYMYTQGADEPQSLILDSLHVPDRVASALLPICSLACMYQAPSVDTRTTPNEGG